MREYKKKLRAGGFILVKDFELIGENYIRGAFLWDFIPLLPLQYISITNKWPNLMYLIKTIRLKKGLQ